MFWLEIGWQGWVTLATLVAVLSLLVSDRVSADMACIGGLAVLLVTGVVSVADGLVGFSNAGVLTIAALYVVAAGLYESGGLRVVTKKLFAPVTSLRLAMARLMMPTAMASGFLNNTPIVAMLIPGTTQWARECRIDSSRLLIPLSYAAILGGTCTLIGTSTNLVVDGMLRESGHDGFSFFAIAWVGLPVALVGLLFMIVVGPYLLPKNEDKPEVFDDFDDFTTEVTVPADSPYIGKPIGEISFGPLEGLAPVAIGRKGILIAAPGPAMHLAKGDRLVFSGPTATILKLHRFDGFAAAHGTVMDDAKAENTGHIVEVVLSQRCPLLGSVVGDGSFRNRYGAAVLAIARQGQRVVSTKVEDWRLRAGDVLLLEAGENFDATWLGREVFVIREHDRVEVKNEGRALWSVFLVLAMICVAVLEILPIFQAALATAVLMVATRVISATDARDSLDRTVLLTIAAAFGIAGAMQSTGVAAGIAAAVVSLGAGPWITLALFYLMTSLMTESITNNAAAALMFPFGLTMAESLAVSPIPFAVATMIAASASFATPLGYQTNLMVYGAGNYRFRDFMRIGILMNLIVAATALAIIPFFFPF